MKWQKICKESALLTRRTVVMVTVPIKNDTTTLSRSRRLIKTTRMSLVLAATKQLSLSSANKMKRQKIAYRLRDKTMDENNTTICHKSVSLSNKSDEDTPRTNWSHLTIKTHSNLADFLIAHLTAFKATRLSKIERLMLCKNLVGPRWSNWTSQHRLFHR
jgi:hypothetical protein